MLLFKIGPSNAKWWTLNTIYCNMPYYVKIFSWQHNYFDWLGIPETSGTKGCDLTGGVYVSSLPMFLGRGNSVGDVSPCPLLGKLGEMQGACFRRYAGRCAFLMDSWAFPLEKGGFLGAPHNFCSMTLEKLIF